MRKIIVLIVSLCHILSASGYALAKNAMADSITDILSECRMDFNGDGIPDEVAILETPGNKYLMVALSANEKSKKPASSRFIERNVSNRTLKCHEGKTVKVAAAVGKAGVVNISGAYLELSSPDGVKTVYYWNGAGFDKALVAD